LQVLVPKPLQQTSPEPPQASQVPALASVRPEQASVPLWHPPPPQQACPEAPQSLHVPPGPVAFGLSQPRPALQGVALRQHASPEPPQEPQTNPPSADRQPSEPVQVKLQQLCPAPPHALQVVPFTQPAPLAVQNVRAPNPASPPPQQAWPTAPHGVPDALEQLPLLQVPETPVPVQASPEPTH
jgi:hypothetical protein